MKFFSTSLEGEVLEVISTEFETLEQFKDSINVNLDDDSVKNWRDGEIKEITIKEYSEFKISKREADAVELEGLVADLDDDDLKKIVISLAGGRVDLAQESLKEVRKKKKEKDEKPKDEKPVEEKPKEEAEEAAPARG